MSHKQQRTTAITQHYRAHLKQYDASIDAHLRTAHKSMVQSLQPAINRLLREIEQARTQATDANGDVHLSPTWLREHGLHAFKAQVTQAIDQYGTLAAHTATAAQQEAYRLGEQAAKAQIAALKDGQS